MTSITDLVTRPGDETTWQRLRREADLPMLVPALLLAALALWCVTYSLVQGNWAEGLGILPAVALGGLVVGTVFARLHWLHAWLAHLLGFILGLIWTVRQLGPQLDPRLHGWGDHATELLIRAIVWGRVLAAGERGEDIVLFVTATALLAFVLGYTTGWLLFRLRWTWPAMVLNAVVILVNYTFAMPKPTVLFFVFLGSAMLLVAQQQIARQQRDWQAAQIEYPDAMGTRFLTAAALFCGGVILVTSLLPGEVSYQRAKVVWAVISQPGRALRNGWEDAFSTINAPPGSSGDGFAARSAQLSGPRVLGDDLVMLVRSTRPDYWRAVARDRYDGHSWENTTGERARAAVGAASAAAVRTMVGPGQTLPGAATGITQTITQTFELRQDRRDSFVFVGGDPLRLSIPTQLEHSLRAQPGAPAMPIYADLAAIIGTSPLESGSSYSVETAAGIADEQSLRQAGSSYPDWVRDRYLQLPDTVSERTRALARRIVQEAKADNPYDQALAVQNYLRRFPYNERIAAPPRDADAVDYFLFDVQQGYCDYYASAMAVLLRSLDVPVRWVNGYATGTLNGEAGAYEVRSSVAHTWPEVYFPGLGWQRFEPTPASYTSVPKRPARPLDAGAASFEPGGGLSSSFPDQPSLAERERNRAEQAARANDGVDATAGGSGAGGGWLLWLVVGLLVAGGTGALLLRRRSGPGLRPASAAYARMALLASLAGLRQPEHATPREYQALLAKHLPEQRDTLATIVQGYTRERYNPASKVSRHEIDAAWKKLRGPLLRLLLRRR